MSTSDLPVPQPADETILLDKQADRHGLAEVPVLRLMWWRFRRNRAAMVGLVITILIYLVAIFADFLSPFDPLAFNPRYSFAPPQQFGLFVTDEEGTRFQPHVLGYISKVDPATFSRSFSPDPENVIPVVFLPEVAPYKLLGMIPLNHRLFGPVESSQPMFVLGSDKLGRDILSRMIHGARISLSIGFFGVLASVLLGTIIGGISGYFGGWADTVIQRVIEFMLSVPTIPLWLALAAVLPRTWDPLLTYLCITLILSLIGWTEMARVVRGRFLSLRTEDYVTAARLDAVSEFRIITRHIMPAMTSHIVAAATLAIPGMILSETALSFLGLGLQPPIVSWGVMLQDAQSIRALVTAPWLMFPGVAVIIAVLALNFLGDGLRDAADPYND